MYENNLNLNLHLHYISNYIFKIHMNNKNEFFFLLFVNKSIKLKNL